ncbi:MAG: substrate-binding domain-containing protein [Clostridiaceae bacterium]|jgi:ABC-type sugar transport system substrate-binding protein|nr:sugar ABC transporter substrate-binding protein [Bacillota bacterium]NLN52367.1 substrate-binding domain-containing protein [Clostridiaceae bacterium]
MKKRVLMVLLVVAMIIGLAACGSGSEKEADPGADKVVEDSEKDVSDADEQSEEPEADDTEGKKEYKIGVSLFELTAYTWFQGAIDGCHEWLADNGEANNVNFTFTFEDSSSDVQTMLTNIENLVAAGSDGIILFPADASSAIPLMKEYTSQGIPFVIGDYKQEPTSEEDMVWSTFVGHDMKALGVKAGEVAVDYLDTLEKDDPVCLFITSPASGQVTQDRYNGFAETVLAAYPNATIIEEGDTGAANRDSAQTLMENVLQRESEIDVVCGHNDALVVGAYNAAVAEGRDTVKFIGIAGDKDVLTWISEGNEQWLAEVLQDPVVLGYQATDAMFKTLVLGEELPEDYDLPQPEAITSENIDESGWEDWVWIG